MSEIKFQNLLDVIGDSWILLDFMSFLNPEQPEQYNGIYISNAMCVKIKNQNRAKIIFFGKQFTLYRNLL